MFHCSESFSLNREILEPADLAEGERALVQGPQHHPPAFGTQITCDIELTHLFRH